MYLPSIVMVGHYFDKKRALATGIAVCGSGTGTFVFAPLGTFLVSQYGWKGANVIFGAIIFHGVVFGAIFRPLDPARPARPPSKEAGGRSKEAGGRSKEAGGRSAVGEALPRSAIIESIIKEKQRGRTPSFDSGAPQSAVNIQVCIVVLLRGCFNHANFIVGIVMIGSIWLLCALLSYRD